MSLTMVLFYIYFLPQLSWKSDWFSYFNFTILFYHFRFLFHIHPHLKMALFRSFTILFILISLTSAFDGDERDSTGCPKAFKGRCKCGKVRNYRYWRSREEIYMVNCTNTMFRGIKLIFILYSFWHVLNKKKESSGVIKALEMSKINLIRS